MITFFLFNIFCFLFICFYIIVEGKSCKFNKNLIIEKHNDFRLKHNAKPIYWNKKLENASQKEANLIKTNSDCILTSKQINTNYFNFFVNNEIELAVNSWYEGINDYDFELGVIKRNNNVFEFTQILWKTVENIGCSTACCKTTGIFICKYDNYPNRPGYFSDNVGTIDTTFVFDDLIVEKETNTNFSIYNKNTFYM
ncbi:cysteine-rich secretory protein, putative [Plasmodium gallinaceum]|uniref:Cysteine-rich secretory protein, putative n=1 Tax=Plasmodium gallinaceum TaxID=5849 RepID=A0A1J1GZZ6_PLAGA|nr:cysteine-rich secretory protein, putative [Plasmodium gallinaceum]CRG98028.1 cysteine-rich secretory protein, putative [Plasmodium gallinaceum]